jgi:HSP20 family protein
MPLHDLEIWMWTEACEILDRADRLHRQFFRPAVMNVRQPTWEPPVDIYESGYELIITIALPGVAPEQLNVIMENNQLVVNGQRHLSGGAESQIRRLEIPYGRFERRIELPVGRFKMESREFINGCLLISLRKI